MALVPGTGACAVRWKVGGTVVEAITTWQLVYTVILTILYTAVGSEEVHTFHSIQLKS